MKKIIPIVIILFVIVATIPTIIVRAAETSVAKIGDVRYDTLEEAINAASTDATITLLGNFALTKSLEVGKNVTIDLNGFRITAADGMTDDSLIIVLHGGTLVIKDSSQAHTGKISATNSSASARVAVKVTKAGNTTDFINNNPAKLILNSGTLEGSSFGISGNGNSDRINTNITINGGTVKGDVTGIYHPQEGEVVIKGGTIKGSTGIEMRSGSLIVYNGTIIGTGAPTDVTANGNGTTTKGAGIAVAQHTTEKNISVVVKGGNIQGYSALYESNPQSNNTMEKVSIKISGGKFEAINGGKLAVYSEDKKGFITGGSFSSDVSAYVPSELGTVEDDDGNVYVGTVHTITEEKSKNGKVEADKTKAVKGQVITLKSTPEQGYELDSIKVYDSNNKEITVSENKFTMPDSEVTIQATFKTVKLATTATSSTTGTTVSGTKVASNTKTTNNITTDKTGAKTKIPDAGATSTLAIIIVGLALLSIIWAIKVRQLKDVI